MSATPPSDIENTTWTASYVHHDNDWGKHLGTLFYVLTVLVAMLTPALVILAYRAVL